MSAARAPGAPGAPAVTTPHATAASGAGFTAAAWARELAKQASPPRIRAPGASPPRGSPQPSPLARAPAGSPRAPAGSPLPRSALATGAHADAPPPLEPPPRGAVGAARLVPYSSAAAVRVAARMPHSALADGARAGGADVQPPLGGGGAVGAARFVPYSASAPVRLAARLPHSALSPRASGRAAPAAAPAAAAGGSARAPFVVRLEPYADSGAADSAPLVPPAVLWPRSFDDGVIDGAIAAALAAHRRARAADAAVRS
jgi:hypothetical protein